MSAAMDRAFSVLQGHFITRQLIIGVGDGGQGGTCPQIRAKIYFSGKNHVKFGHFVKFFGHIFSGKNALLPQS